MALLTSPSAPTGATSEGAGARRLGDDARAGPRAAVPVRRVQDWHGRRHRRDRLLRVLLVVAPFLAYSAVVNDLADERIDPVNLPGTRAACSSPARHTAGSCGRRRARRRGQRRSPPSRSGGRCSPWPRGLAVSTAYTLGPVRLAERGILASLHVPACYVGRPLLLGLLAAGGARAGDLPLRRLLRRLRRPHHPQGLPGPSRGRPLRERTFLRPPRAGLDVPGQRALAPGGGRARSCWCPPGPGPPPPTS